MLASLRAKPKGWRTIIINVLIGVPSAALALLQAFDGVDVSPLFGSDGPAVMAGMAVLGIILRLITSSPVGKKA